MGIPYTEYKDIAVFPSSSLLKLTYTVKTEIIGHHARTLELPLLVRSVSQVRAGREFSSRCFPPLIQRGNSGSSGAMPNYFGFHGILPGMLAKIEKILEVLVWWQGMLEFLLSKRTGRET